MTRASPRRAARAVAGLAVAAAGTLAACSAAPAGSLPPTSFTPPAHGGFPPPASPAPAPDAAPPVLSPVAAPAGGLDPAQVTTAYDVAPLWKAGITGAGQTIVIVDSFGSPTITADLAKFDSYFGLPAPPSLRILQPAGPVPAYQPGDGNRVNWAEETTLDVEWAHVMAPGAAIVLAETPTSEDEGTTGFPQVVQAETYVLTHHIGQVISQSFAATEPTFPSASSIMSFRGAYQLAQRDGVTVVAGSGDDGATGYTYDMHSLYARPVVSWPSTDPLVTAVGGTQLDLAADGSRLGPDTAWHDSGGGVSAAFARPAWQDGVQAVTGAARGVPDISMDASCASPAAIYGSFYPGGPKWGAACGTSLATPLFAAVVALAGQYAGHGKTRGLGLVNPALYQLAASHAPGIVDVTSGDNSHDVRSQDGQDDVVTGYSARPGYDLVTGNGTVDAARFVPELAAAAG